MTLHDEATTPHVFPYYIGGPLDGGCGALEPTHAVTPSIRRAGGVYRLVGFRVSLFWIDDILRAAATPDRAVYQWEAAK